MPYGNDQAPASEGFGRQDTVFNPTSTPIMPPAAPTPTFAKSKRHLPSLVLVLFAVLVVLLGGSAAAYFGYYMNPGTIWQQSLSNTGKGYDQLVDYLNTQSHTHYRGFKEDGSFQVTTDGTSFNGSLSAQSDGQSATGSFKLDLGVSKYDLEVRSLEAAGVDRPDIYLQLNGLKSIGDLIGGDLGPKVDALDGQWIVVDHNLISDAEQQVAKQESAKTPAMLSWDDVNDFLKAAGTVNRQYLFSTNENTAVTTIVKRYGKEMVDGHKTYHYKVGFVKAHVKAYVTAICGALAQSKLGAYLKQTTGQGVADSSTCSDLEKSTDQIKTSDTIDVWADTGLRLIYKVRISDPTDNPAQNFVDIGLNYKGGSSYPFFISGRFKGSNPGTFSVVATLDSQANSLKTVITANTTGDNATKVQGNFTLAPSTTKLSISAPANAKSVTDVVHSLGLGQEFDQLQSMFTSNGTSGLPVDTSLIPIPTQI